MGRPLDFEGILLFFCATSLAAIVVASLVLEKAKNVRPDTPNNDNDIGQDSRRVLAGQEGATERWHPQEREHRETERYYWRVQARIASWALVLTAAAFAGLVINVIIATNALRESQETTREARRQANAAEAQIAIAKDTAIKQLRAYLIMLPRVEVDLEFLIDGTLTIHYKNAGQSPAYHVEGIAFASFSDFPFQNGIPPASFADEPITSRFLSGGVLQTSIVGPAEPVRSTVSMDTISLKDFADFVLRKKALVVVGSLYYDDIFNVPHYTKFCNYMLWPIVNTSINCRLGNEAN